MIAVGTLLAFVAASALLVAIPGPSVLFVIGRSLAYGRRAGVLSVVGNAIGIVPAVVAVAFGVGALVAESVVVFTIVKLAGAAYLVWLGIQAIRHRHAHASATVGPPLPARRLLVQGFVVGVTNPKTVAFLVAILPQFASPVAGPAWAQLLVLGATFVVVALAGDTVWALAAGTARRWFARSPRRLSTLTATGGAMMIGLGGVLAVSGSRA